MRKLILGGMLVLVMAPGMLAMGAETAEAPAEPQVPEAAPATVPEPAVDAEAEAAPELPLFDPEAVERYICMEGCTNVRDCDTQEIPSYCALGRVCNNPSGTACAGTCECDC